MPHFVRTFRRAGHALRAGLRLIAVVIFVSCAANAAVAQPPDPFLSRAFDRLPLLAQQNPTGQESAAAPPSAQTAQPPTEKEEGDKAGAGEKKDDTGEKKEEKKDQTAEPGALSVHSQITAIAQGDPGFPAQYSGPNSLNSLGERQGTLTADLFLGAGLWQGGEVHLDGLMWQGYGLSQTFGIEDFPNGDAYKAGTTIPDFTAAHFFFRQTFGLGGKQEDVPDGPLTIAGKQDISRLTVTVGRFAASDVFDNNTYAHDPHTQFLNWAAVTNVTWDYPADPIGYTTGMALELNQPDWTLRYGFFQMPSVRNGFTADDRIFTWPGQGGDGPFFLYWAMATELERRWSIEGHKGAIRFLAWLNEANMFNYSDATAYLRANPPPADLLPGADDVPAALHAFRCKYGFGLNWEQEIAKNVGLFSRVGWSDGQDEAWTYTDANWSVSLGLSVKGPLSKRPDDTFGLLGVVSGTSHANQEYLEAAGLGILDGDGALSYSPEKVLETYYNFQLEKSAQLAFDYEFVADPAFNSARGPVSVFAMRLHWEF